MMKLAVAQMVLGALIVVGVIVVDLVATAAGIYRWLSFMPRHYEVLLSCGYLVFLVCGLLVLICGAAQYLKAREERIKHDARP